MKEKLDSDLKKQMLKDFWGIVKPDGRVEFDEHGAQKEPASRKPQAEQLLALADRIINDPDIDDTDKEEVARIMEARVRDYLERILNSGR